MRLFKQLGTISILATVAAMSAACGNSDNDAVFTDNADDNELVVDIATSGVSSTLVLLAVFAADDADAQSCPAATTSGDTVTLSGGCIDDNGQSFEGEIILTNAAESDDSQPTIIEYRNFLVEADSDRFFADGVIELRPGGESIAVIANYAIESRNEGREITASFDARLDCSDTEEEICTYADGATAELGGVGRFAISGTMNDFSSGVLTLTGENTLTIDTAPDENDCVTVRVDDNASQQVCP